jgi:hypothetical protein
LLLLLPLLRLPLRHLWHLQQVLLLLLLLLQLLQQQLLTRLSEVVTDMVFSHSSNWHAASYAAQAVLAASCCC